MKIKSDLSELTFQLIVESSPNAIVLVNSVGKIVYVNKQTERLFGYNNGELLGHPVEVLIPARYVEKHPGFREAFFDSPAERAMGAGRELFAMRKNGTEFPIEIGLNPVSTSEKKFVLASIIDITARKKAENQFKLVVESAPNAMVLVNQFGDITLVNKQTEILFGYDRNELIGKKLEMLIPERFGTHHPEHRSEFFKNPQTRAMGTGRDLFAKRKNGKEVQVEIGLNPIDTADGQMVLASIIEITERKMREFYIKKQVELEAKNKELKQFAYVASHDLQEPLRTVSNYMQVFEEDYGEKLDDDAIRYITSIKGATKRMSILVKALLDFSRLGSNKSLGAVSCKKVIQDVLDDLHGMITSTKAVIIIGELPELNAYELELRQLFQNLITNAIKFQKKNNIPKIEISAKKENDHWIFSVKDNGIGIPSDYFDRIFEIFQRLHSSSEYEGHGVGLANCKRIVELHQGEIWVESIYEHGATFNFSIPILNYEQ